MVGGTFLAYVRNKTLCESFVKGSKMKATRRKRGSAICKDADLISSAAWRPHLGALLAGRGPARDPA